MTNNKIVTPKHKLGVAFELENMKISKYTWMFWLPIVYTFLSIIILLFVWIAYTKHPEWSIGELPRESRGLNTLVTPALVDFCTLSNIFCNGDGVASYYDYTLDSGWSSVGHYVAASRDYPRGSKVLVTNIETGKSVQVLITDFGPDASIFPERVIDLSSTAFKSIGDIKKGIINVKVSTL